MSLLDKIRGAGGGISDKVGEMAETLPEVEDVQNAARKAVIRKYSGFGTLWDNDEDGNFRPLGMGYIVAAGLVGAYFLIGRK